MKILVPLSLMLFLFISCQNEETNLDLSERTYTTASLAECKDDLCPKIDIKLIQAEGNSELSKTINNSMEDVVAASLTMSPDEEAKIETIDQGITNFIDAFRMAKTDFPESAAAQGYEFTSSSKVSFKNEDLLSIKMDTYSYWGGAHGYSDTKYLNFDLKTGKELSDADLVKKNEDFKKLAETKFRKQQGIAAEANINEKGYFFEDDTFSLPNNIGFEDGNMILIYNPYEVAPYAEGQITIKIPKEEAAPFLAVQI